MLIAILSAAACTNASSTQLQNTSYEKESFAFQEKNVSGSPNFIRVAEKAMPATVFIKVQLNQQIPELLNPYDMFGDDFFRKFFGQPLNPHTEQQPQASGGSGFIISEDGYIVTNHHVIKDAAQITVVLEDGREFTPTIKGADPRTDVALLKIEEKNLPYLTFGDSDELKIGEDVAAAGNPFGIKGMLTRGIVSAKGKQDLGLIPYEDMIVTDTAINPGNSGGPLMTLDGKVVGINTAIFSKTGGYMGIGFCIPSNMARPIIDQLMSSGNVKRAFLGVILQPVDLALSEALGLDKQEGVLVSEVMKDSPALNAGIQQGDIILQYNDKLVKNVAKFRNEIALMTPGSEIKLKVLRNNAPMTLSFKLGALTEGEAISAELTEKLGIEIENLSSEHASRLGYSSESEGVWIKNVKRNSPAAMAGLSQTFLITGVGANLNSLKKVKNKSDFENALQELSDKKHIIILVRHQNFQRYYTIKMQ